MSDPVLSLTVTVKTKDALGQASPWIRFLSILGFIGVGLLAVAGLLLVVFGSSFGRVFGLAFFAPLLGVVYVALAVVVFFPTHMLLRLASRGKKYAGAGDPTDLEAFAVQVRGLSRFYGIFAIVMIAVYAVALIVVVAFVVLR